MKHLIAAAALLGASTSLGSAATVDAIYAFGDSLNDCCVNPQAPFTNGPDSWIVELARQVGADYTDSADTNYAIGGAQSGDFNAIAFGGIPAADGLAAQIERFKRDDPAIGSEDLALIWVGTNDIWASSYAGDDLFGTAGLRVVKPLGVNPDPIDLARYVSGNIRTAVAHLRDGGFSRVLVLTPYDIGDAALFDVPGGPEQNTAYSEALRDSLLARGTPGIDTYVLDVVDLIRALQTGSPGNGFIELTTDPSCGGPGVCEARSQAEQDSFVYYDFVHLTTATNSAIATAAAATVLRGVPVAPIPLPAGGLLLLCALGGLIVLRRAA